MNPLNPMSLRTVTIWTTGLLLVATLVVPPILVYLVESKAIFSVDAPVLWIFAGSTLFVSYVVSFNLKYALPAAILLFSTTAYSLVYVLALLVTIFIEAEAFLLLFFVGIAFFPTMIPVWIITVVLELAERQENR